MSSGPDLKRTTVYGNVFFHLLPYIEQDARFYSYDFDPAGFPGDCIQIGSDVMKGSPFPPGAYESSVQNNPPWQSPVPGGGPATQTGGLKVYYCPSRRSADPHPGWRAQKNDYAAVVPPHIPLDPTHSPEDEFWGDNGRYFGVITPGNSGWNDKFKTFYPRVTFADIIDGTSNTMAIGEKFMPTWAYNAWWSGDGQQAKLFAALSDICRDLRGDNHAAAQERIEKAIRHLDVRIGV